MPKVVVIEADIVNKLTTAGVPRESAEQVTALLPRGLVGLLLYGSFARGDNVTNSDVDLLALVTHPQGSRKSGALSLSCYTPAQLSSAAGTLFGMHLARDGVIVTDTDDRLSILLHEMGEPEPNQVFERIRHLAAVLDDTPEEHLPGRVRIARYLLRTAIYVTALASGEPCFSVRELASRLQQPELVDLLSSNQTAPVWSSAVLEDLSLRLEREVGSLARNTHGSLRNLVVAEWYDDLDRATLGALALASDASPYDYAALPKVLL
ncbi:MAG: nucleotidyltransferase domain-containing protein [Ilumatobacteraceae bacterium]